MTITASMVKELRDKTGAGMMECKKALVEVGGDIEQAVDELRKRGAAIAQKKGGRAIKEGRIFATVADGAGALVELGCETDFVARNEEFIAFGEELARLVLAGGEAIAAAGPREVAGLHSPRHGKTVEEALTDTIAKLGENMTIARFVRYEAGKTSLLSAYIHPPGKLGVLLELTVGNRETFKDARMEQLGRDLSMQIAAAAPIALDRESIPASEVERERNIYREQLKMEGKPEKIWDKIVEGKMGKFYKQSCLLEQEFVKDSDLTIRQLLEKLGKELGDTLEIKRFARFEVGGDDEDDAE